jgi:ATP-dependent Clp protease adaptor protein ClpS|tara:strand:- start:2369 stop:2677 length:309 start_codon:yes stop_codon:yes gene_type:complete
MSSAEFEVEIDEKIEKEIKEPDFYKVVFLNDEQTPVEFVIEIIQDIFGHSEKTAEAITLTVHNEGSGIVGVYTYEIAEQKGVETVKHARASGFPLQVKVEVE